jgi:uncharacterized protein
MILGRITGKTTTKNFKFEVFDKAQTFEYVQIMHSNGEFVLGIIDEIEKDLNKTIAFCSLIGFRNSLGKLEQVKYPLNPQTEVLRAEDEFIKEILELEGGKGKAYIGVLDGRDNLRVYLDLNRVLSKHVSVLAKSGSGKSYSIAVLLEEILKRKVPIVVIDPHGEYSSLKYPNPKDKEGMLRFGIEPEGFLKQITEFSTDIKLNPDAKPLKLSKKNLNSSELIHMLPIKLSSSQLGIIYSALKNLGGRVDFDDLLFEIETAEDSSSKWTLIDILNYVKKLDLFGESPTLMGELVSPGEMSIINLRGVDSQIQEIVVYKLISDLFMERKKNNLPPFFLVIEECHNFIPERSFGQAKSSAIIRQVAAEGRKFGLGLCLISQRPSRVDKSALSQTSTQIILKVTNPNDIKAISNSIEGITSATEKAIPNIPIGTALVTGVVDLPLIVNFRPRMSKHGGEAVSNFLDFEEMLEDTNFEEKVEEFEKVGENLPLIKQKFDLNDVQLMHGKESNITLELIPCVLIHLSKRGEEFKVLIDLVDLQIIENVENVSGISLLSLNLKGIDKNQEKLLDIAIKLNNNFKPTDLLSLSGLQFSDVYSTINILTQKGYFLREDSTFKLSEDILFLANINEKQFYQEINYSRTNGQKLEKKYEFEIVKDFLNKFFEVKNLKECYIERYKVIKDQITTEL